MFVTYDIIVADSMELLIEAVTAALGAKQPLGAPFLNRQSQWCQAMVS